MMRTFLCALVCLVLGTPGSVTAQDTGRLDGQLTNGEGRGVGGVTVQIVELQIADITNMDGRYVFSAIRPGSYTVIFSLGDNSLTRSDVRVEAGASTTVDTSVDWKLAFAETITVNAASRRPERIVDAPAAVTMLTRQDIERQASAGQVPRTLAFTPGVELTQVSLNDFNLNTRGFNSAFNRRILTIIDGRDPSIPGLTGAQEWGSPLSPLDDLESIEFVRGPGAALYGAGAFNGVLVMTSKAPRDSLGGKLRVSFGELHTQRYQLRHAGSIGGGWYLKVLGGYERSRDFTRSRVTSVEYAPGVLMREAIAPPLDRYQSGFGSLRVDKYFSGDRVLTLEGGASTFEGTTNVSDLGRVQQTDVARPWIRFNLNAPRWNVLASSSRRTANDQAVLSSGGTLFLDSFSTAVEVQGNRVFDGGRGRAVGGAYLGVQYADSRNPEGVHTIYSAVADERDGAVYGQVDYHFTPSLGGVFSLRWDESTLHNPRWSPRAAVIYTAAPGHTVRFTYNNGFKRPTLSELFVKVPVAPPVDLSALERSLAPVLGGVSLDFESIPMLAIGNEDLAVEEIQSVELGYNAVLGTRVFVTASVYYNRLANFTTTLLPQLGTSFGRLNEHYGPYRPPAALPPASAAVVVAALHAAIPTLVPIMSNDVDEAPIFVALSNRNYGRVDTRGLELSVSYAVAPNWTWTANYNHFDFTVKEDVPESPLLPNAPAHQVSTGISYVGQALNGSIRYRWVEGFPWSTGLFTGPVKAYGVVDAHASRQLTRVWSIGVDVANLLDREHYEMFGGDLLGRRAMANLSVAW